MRSGGIWLMAAARLNPAVGIDGGNVGLTKKMFHVEHFFVVASSSERSSRIAAIVHSAGNVPRGTLSVTRRRAGWWLLHSILNGTALRGCSGAPRTFAAGLPRTSDLAWRFELSA